ncbi:MAG: sulfurtransferase [SAR324 cluster bacterium]|nr:sulfurtransferase [SAR324 cluster bacterium]
MILWTPEILHQHLSDTQLKIVDVRQGEAYANGHIPGAQHFSVYGINTYDTDKASLRSFVHSWAFQLGRCGVGPQSKVVFYEDLSGATAARAHWFLEYFGHKQVHILDGGLQAWLEAGYSVTQNAQLPEPVNYDYTLQNDRVASYQDILNAIGQDSTIILDTRADDEWFGTRRSALRNGTIPGAIHLEWVHNLDAKGRFKSVEQLRQLYQNMSITDDKEVIALCNTGYRSALACVALRLMSFSKVRNYVGSWQEWGNREGMPIIVPKDPVKAPLQ